MARRSTDDFGYALAEAVAERATAPELLALLRGLGDAAAAIITLPAPGGSPAEVVAVDGYDAAVVGAITAPQFSHRDPAYRLIRRDPQRPLRCWWDLGFDYGAVGIGRELLVPAGYRGGVSLRLNTRYGRHVGDLHMSTEDRRYPTPEAMRALHRSRHVLAELCLTTEPDLGDAPADTDVVRVWSEGRVETLRVGPDRRVSAGLADLALRHAGSVVPGAPARVRRWFTPEGTWHRVVIHGAARATAVGTRPEPIPFDLSHRELEVLGLLSTGLSNFSISRRLDRSERTIAHCVERILEKLGVESRAGAAAIAESDGLIIIE